LHIPSIILLTEKGIAKKNSSGTVLSSMVYNSQDRLVDLDKTTFVYDFLGRPVKASSLGGQDNIYQSNI
jgi:hypothetical protein